MLGTNWIIENANLFPYDKPVNGSVRDLTSLSIDALTSGYPQ